MSYHTSAECHEHHDIVRDFGGERPKIVCLCGSTRFKDEFNRVNAELTMQGYLVISLGVFGHVDMPDREDLWITNGSETKIMLDALHKRKIDLADEVLVVSDEAGYFGESTWGEIQYAWQHGKPVEFVQIAAKARALVLAEGVFA
jgi:hypothetical protein